MNRVPLGERMKKYEESTNFRIIPRTPVMIRIDGKKFSSLTKRLKLEKPFDRVFANWMAATAARVCGEIQGCVLAYTQSDEITFVIRTDQTDDTTPWFDNRIQKIVSIASSVAAVEFNCQMWNTLGLLSGDDLEEANRLRAHFDCRVWPMPSMTEVVNNLIWRQRDCTKNSISSAAYYEVGKIVGRGTVRKMLHNLKQDERQELLFSKAGINWNDYPAEFKRGMVVYRVEVQVETENGVAIRKRWTNSPASIFTSERGREWLNGVLNPGREEDVKEEKRVG
jgi:tRNA(His) 5'-end guanylyltransferase